MSDLNQTQRQNLSVVDDAPPTQPQSLPETPTLQDVQQAALFLPDQAIRELYSYFGVKAADELAETDWREFIRLANMPLQGCRQQENSTTAERRRATRQHHHHYARQGSRAGEDGISGVPGQTRDQSPGATAEQAKAAERPIPPAYSVERSGRRGGDVDRAERRKSRL